MEAIGFLQYFLLVFAGGILIAAVVHIAASMVADARDRRAQQRRLRRALEHACLGTTEIDGILRDTYGITSGKGGQS